MTVTPYKAGDFKPEERPASTRCRWCGDLEAHEFLSLGANNDLGLSFNLARCRACGAVMVSPPPPEPESRAYFMAPARWLVGLDPDGRPVDPAARGEARRREYQKYARALADSWNNATLPDRVMDVGAGSGLMLSLLDPRLERLAVEPNPQAAGLAEERGLKVVRDWAENLNPPPRSLGALIMNQSLDHLPEPGDFFNKAQDWVAPGGFILISGLINPDCLIARIYGERFRLWHPLHQLYLTPAALMRLVGAWGFSPLAWWQPYFDTPYGSLGRLLKSLPQVAAAAFGQGRGPSPAWPGNTFSILAQKLLPPRKVSVPGKVRLTRPAETALCNSVVAGRRGDRP